MAPTGSTRRPAARGRDAQATRGAILESATEAFCRAGYDGAGTREIARAAGVDPRLITRYFGSKEHLFAEVVDVMYRKPLLMAPGQNGPVAAALLADAPRELDGLLLTLRSAANPRAAEIMRAHLEANYQLHLTEALPGDDTRARAALLISICAGVQLMRNVLRNSALRDGDTARVVPHLEAALDVIAQGTAGEHPRSRARTDPPHQA
jgi:AcrR family transcriptional regulator